MIDLVADFLSLYIFTEICISILRIFGHFIAITFHINDPSWIYDDLNLIIAKCFHTTPSYCKNIFEQIIAFIFVSLAIFCGLGVYLVESFI